MPTPQPSFVQSPGPRALWEPGLRGYLWGGGYNQPLPPTVTHEPRVAFPGQRPGPVPSCRVSGQQPGRAREALAGPPCASKPIPGAKGLPRPCPDLGQEGAPRPRTEVPQNTEAPRRQTRG